MKDHEIKRFFTDNKQSIPDSGFESRLFATLDCLPQNLPVKKEGIFKKRWFIMSAFATAGFLLFVLAGGYSQIVDSLIAVGGGLEGIKSMEAQAVVSLLFLFCLMFGIGKFAVESE